MAEHWSWQRRRCPRPLFAMYVPGRARCLLRLSKFEFRVAPTGYSAVCRGVRLVHSRMTGVAKPRSRSREGRGGCVRGGRASKIQLEIFFPGWGPGARRSIVGKPLGPPWGGARVNNRAGTGIGPRVNANARCVVSGFLAAPGSPRSADYGPCSQDREIEPRGVFKVPQAG